MTAERWEESPKGMSGTGRNVSSSASYTYTTSKSCKRRCITGWAPLCRSKHEACEHKSVETLLCDIGIGSYQTGIPDLQHKPLWQLDLHLHSLRVHLARPEHAWLLQMMSV